MSGRVLLFVGPSETSRLIGSTMDKRIIAEVARAVLRDIPTSKDPILRELTAGRRRALKMLVDGGEK